MKIYVFFYGNVSQCHYSETARQFLSNDELFAQECSILSVKEISKKYNISETPIYQKVKQLKIILPNW